MPPRSAAASGHAIPWSTYALAALPVLLAAFAFVLQLRGATELRDVELTTLSGADLRQHASLERHAELHHGGASHGGDSRGSGAVASVDWVQAVVSARSGVLQRSTLPALGVNAAGQVPFVTEAAERVHAPNGSQILISTTTGDRVRRIKQWYRYHRAIGVERFYLFVEGHAATPGSVAALRALDGVRVFLRTPALEASHASSRIWNEKWLASFFHKPCNYELFVRQNLNLETAIATALADGNIGWIAHIDTDEMLYPAGASDFSLLTLLAAVPANLDVLVFPNYESAVERDDVSDPFTQVTMFKRNFDHVVREVYFAKYKEMTRGNPNYFLTYGNGKAAARLVPGLRPNGAHRFHNYVRAPREGKAIEAAVLHFTYSRFEDVRARRGRCNCGNTDDEIALCFILEFDRWVFRKASSELDDVKLRDWYRQHVVWTDTTFSRSQLANGLFARIHAPALLVAVLDAAAAAEDARDEAAADAAEQQQQTEPAGHTVQVQ